MGTYKQINEHTKHKPRLNTHKKHSAQSGYMNWSWCTWKTSNVQPKCQGPSVKKKRWSWWWWDTMKHNKLKSCSYHFWYLTLDSENLLLKNKSMAAMASAIAVCRSMSGWNDLKLYYAITSYCIVCTVIVLYRNTPEIWHNDTAAVCTAQKLITPFANLRSTVIINQCNKFESKSVPRTCISGGSFSRSNRHDSWIPSLIATTSTT